MSCKLSNSLVLLRLCARVSDWRTRRGEAYNQSRTDDKFSPSFCHFFPHPHSISFSRVLFSIDAMKIAIVKQMVKLGQNYGYHIFENWKWDVAFGDWYERGVHYSVWLVNLHAYTVCRTDPDVMFPVHLSLYKLTHTVSGNSSVKGRSGTPLTQGNFLDQREGSAHFVIEILQWMVTGHAKFAAVLVLETSRTSCPTNCKGYFFSQKRDNPH